jgi:hypothetical protein
MAGIVYTKLIDALKGIGVDVSQQQASNVKKLAPKNKSTATKPGLLASERDTGGNFATVLDIFKNEAKYIDSMNDAEQMAFLNNILDYNEFGGKSINKTSEGISGLQTDLDKITSTAKTMKDDAEKGLASAEKDLKDFLDTGGQPLKVKSDKYLGGSMHEEGQLRTAIRTFLRNEYKNGKIKLDKDDQFRIMEYSPMMEDDPIKVFKKIYGEEAYNKAGTFPGAFEKGENFNHYEAIFKENMGEDILKVKDKKYVGDGKLILTKQEEVFEPTPDVDDDGTPFAKGGRASFVGGKIVDELVAMIIKKEPMDAMKEVNKIIGKKGKYKNLTQKDIDRIVDQTNDHIFQRDPDNLYVEDRPMFKQKDKPDTQVFKDSEGGIKGITMGGDDEFKKAMSEAMEEGMRESENMKRLGLDPTKMKDALKYDEMKAAGQLEKNVTGSADLSPAEDLKKEFPGISDENVRLILADTNPQRIAEVKQTMREAMEMEKKGMSVDEIINAFKNSNRTKQADGGITKLRNGYYGGGQAMVEPDLSDIGHGSDSLMARTRLTSPGSQATTSTGLNYLLGEDNDNTRVPFQGGGGADASTTSFSRSFDKQHGTNTVSRANKTVDARQAEGQRDADRTNERMQNTNYLIGETQPSFNVKAINAIDTVDNINKFYNFANTLNPFNLVKSNPYAFALTGILSLNERRRLEKLREEQENSLQPFQGGGVAGLRQGYAGGNLVDKGRRGFLKFLGGTAAGVVALKAGLVKLLGKDSGAISKKALDEVIIEGGSGAPAWLQPLVNKALREGKDISQNAIKDGQVVKSLDTPTGKVDVYYDARTGEIDIDYIGGNTALGESVNMRYTPGIADEGTKGVKPADEFEAVESIPEGKAYGPDDYEIEMGENVTDNVGGLFSDTTELAELGGQKTLTKDIVETVKKKKILKQMENNPSDFVTDTQGDFVQFDDINPDPN